MKASEIVITYKKAKEIQYQPKLLLEIIFNNKNFFIRKNINLIKENRAMITPDGVNVFYSMTQEHTGYFDVNRNQVIKNIHYICFVIEDEELFVNSVNEKKHYINKNFSVTTRRTSNTPNILCRDTVYYNQHILLLHFPELKRKNVKEECLKVFNDENYIYLIAERFKYWVEFQKISK